ncbi:MAG: DinB family protein [Bacteroidota bacterium]
MLRYRSLTDRQRTQHEAIEAIAENTSSDRLLLQPNGKWSIKDNVAHLAKYQPVFIDRINRILLRDEPAFESYRAENDHEFPLWQTWEMRTLLDRLYADREEINLLINDLSYTQLSLAGVHKKFGRLTIIQWTEFFLLHEAHHMFTIFQLANNIEL